MALGEPVNTQKRCVGDLGTTYYKICMKGTTELPEGVAQPKEGFGTIRLATKKIYEITRGRLEEAEARFSVREFFPPHARPPAPVIKTQNLLKFPPWGREIPVHTWCRYFPIGKRKRIRERAKRRVPGVRLYLT